MRLALTRAVPPSIASCELTHRSREPIDAGRAVEQHRRYEEALAALGCSVQRLPATPALPDSVFVEDAAVVTPEIAVLTNPGAPSRQPEVATVAGVLRRYRPLASIESPATLDGGDVLRVGRRIYVGRSGRTNAAGIARLAELLEPRGYVVVPMPLTGCLHLKSAATEVGEATVLLNPAWVDRRRLGGLDVIEVHPDEPFAANALRIGPAVIHSATFPRTRERLERRGIVVTPVEAGELEKAEAGVTCCSIILDA